MVDTESSIFHDCLNNVLVRLQIMLISVLYFTYCLFAFFGPVAYNYLLAIDGTRITRFFSKPNIYGCNVPFWAHLR